MCPALEKDTQRSEDAYERLILHQLQHFTCRENSLQGSLSTSRNSTSRNWRDAYQADNPDTNDPIIEEDTQDLTGRRQFSIHLGQALRTRQLVIDFDGGQPIIKLREPLDLFTFPSSSYPFQGVRWPTECEVINDIIHHIEWDPPEPEPFYQPTGHERAPMPVGEEKGNVVYRTDLATKTPYFTYSRVGGSRRPIKSAAASAPCQREPVLDFESRFESGNLQKAVQVGVHDYELTLRTDMYTNKHTQWFYFKVWNMKAGVTYRFTIVNMMKAHSLYSLGMRPLLYSERAAKEKGVGWHRIGSNIRYYRNCKQATEDNNSNSIALHSLTWTCQFPYDSDTCYLAHCYPYTYSRLQHYLRRLASDPVTAAYCKLRVLCHSLARNPVHVLTVTSPRGSWAVGRPKKAVVLTARVHPGETNGSWMMEGFLDFLLGGSDDAQLLRDTFVFKVVPMLNPDGVVVGNYRCSLAGRDLNRNYSTMLRDSFPCVWHTRNMVKRLLSERDVVLYCDFHGHSRKNNVFMYGCNDRRAASLQLHERVFPLMMSKNANDKFSFRSCKFRVQKSKEGTGRIVMWRMGIRNSYTMESTFGGSTLGNRRGTHFTTRDLKSLGYHFCDTLLDYCDPDPSKTAYCLTELATLLREEVRERLGKEVDADCNISISDLESSTSGSNSTDSDGPPLHLLKQAGTVRAQQKLLRKHRRSRKERSRLRQERAESNTQPTVLHSSINSTEPNLPVEDVVRERIQEKTVRRDKKNERAPCVEELNSLIRQPALPRSATQLRGSGDMSVWQDSQPAENECLEATRAAYLHRRVRACPQLSTPTTKPAHTEEAEEDKGKRRCTTTLLHLSVPLPPQPRATESARRQQQTQGLSFVARKGLRGRLPASLPAAYRSPSDMQFKVVPEVVATRDLELCLSKSSTQQPGIDRSASRVSVGCLVSRDLSSTSHTHTVKCKQQSRDSRYTTAYLHAGLSLWDGTPLTEQDQREPATDNLNQTEPDNYCFLHGLRGTDLKGHSLLDDQAGIAVQRRRHKKRSTQRVFTLKLEPGNDAITAGPTGYNHRLPKGTSQEDEKQVGIFPAVSSRTSGLLTVELPPSQLDAVRSPAPQSD